MKEGCDHFSCFWVSVCVSARVGVCLNEHGYVDRGNGGFADQEICNVPCNEGGGGGGGGGVFF